MCGIAGLFVPREAEGRVDVAQLGALKGALLHRGPDGSGEWVSPNARCGLAHTRLAIVELSPAGAQPMKSDDGRFHITFNGEIYNHEELRRDLEATGHRFRSRSDTEVLVALYAKHGPDCLQKLDGMFAFAVYDSEDHTLFCARDPLGEKPLYLSRRAGLVAFASEVRALVSAGVVSGAPDLEGIGLFLRQGSIPPPWTHVSGVEFLPPGTWVRFGAGSGQSAPQRYYRIPFTSEAEALTDRRTAIELVHAALLVSVRRRLRSDVPVGGFLSGGLDSSVTAAMMVAAGARDFRTFTVTLPGRASDEAAAARRVAEHLGTKHTEIPLELDAKHDWLDKALDAMDVPSVDGPNTWLVSRAVRDAGVKVACSGLGGDELFFGYPSFDVVPRTARYTRLLRPLSKHRRLMRRVAASLPVSPRVGRALDAALAGGSLAAIWFAKRGLYGEHELRELLEASLLASAGSVDPIGRIERLGAPRDISAKRQVSFFELSVYMHDQLLRDTDTMSMAHALEVRVPLIGRDVIAAVTSVTEQALAGPTPKHVLREIASKYLPRESLQHPKHGFTLDWQSILLNRSTPTDPTARGLLLPNAIAHERERMRSTGRGFARPLALEVLARRCGARASR